MAKEFMRNAMTMARTWEPADTGINAVSVMPVATVTGNIIDVRGLVDFRITVNIAMTGTHTTGLANLVLTCYDGDDFAYLTDYALVTAMNIKASNVVVVNFGRSYAAKLKGTSGSPALAADADILRVPAKIQCKITTTEIGNGTTSVASVRVHGSM